MVFLFDSFSFPFSYAHVETCWPFENRLLRSIDSSLWSWCHRAPFTTADLNKFVKQNLIILVDVEVLFISQEVFGLLPLFSVPFKLLRDLMSFFLSNKLLADAVHLFNMRFHFLSSDILESLTSLDILRCIFHF